jgi:hypothetical protein
MASTRSRGVLGLSSEAVGENQDADDGDSDHAKEERHHPPTILMIDGWGMQIMFCAVWDHKGHSMAPVPWPTPP